MQVAYGVDTDGNDAINRPRPTRPATDPDPNVSPGGGDEWNPNVTGERPVVA